jgi:hypothetical protein
MTIRSTHKLYVPGKFFLAGEYLALRGGPTLTAAMKPYFSFHRSNLVHSLHPQSPAGRLSSGPLKGLLHDPHENKGGMGLSTAEFIFQYCENIKSSADWGSHQNEVIRCWQNYRRLHSSEKNPPSGVDLITQLRGGYVMTHLQNQMWIHKEEHWPFADWDWVLVKTGVKLPTHEHLKSDLNYLNYTRAEDICANVVKGFYQKDRDLFLTSMMAWGEWLEEEKLLAQHSKELILEVQNLPGFKLAKGCGAMGSDQVFILFERSKKEEFQLALRQKKINSSQVQFSIQHDTRGLHFEDT